MAEPWVLAWITAIVSACWVFATHRANRHARRAERAKHEAEIEKLRLEHAILRKPPDFVAECRKLHDRLEAVIRKITGTADPDYASISELHDLHREAAFLLPDDLRLKIRTQIENAIKLYGTNRKLESRTISDDERGQLADENADALMALDNSIKTMVDDFAAFLRSPAADEQRPTKRT